jgi:5-methylcytosine-specific restriction endonuclease McrA
MGAAELLAWEAGQPKVCHWCGIRCNKKWHVDHRFPLAKGGAHEKRNLVIACPGCNVRKGARDPVEFAQTLGKLL